MIHTKEPWELRNSSAATYILAKDSNGHIVTIAAVFPRGIAGCETEGNAKLIKAAPKMYQKLEEIAEGKGGYSMDRLTHAENTIEDLKALALEALAEVEGGE